MSQEARPTMNNEPLVRIGGQPLAAALTAAVGVGQVGIQVAVYEGSELVVDGTAGLADSRRVQAADHDTLWPVFSVTKAVTATAVNIQIDRGLLDPAAPIATYWPEFGAAGKQDACVEDAITHRVGLPDMPLGATTERTADWDWVVDGLAAMAPRFPPGTTNAYHPASWGWIVGELVCRTDPARRSLPAFVREEVLDPLGIDDLWMGTTPAIEPRMARLEGPLSIAGREPHMVGACDDDDPWNDPATWRVGSPSGGAVMTARAGARLFAMLANGGALDGTRILSEKRLIAALEPRQDPFAPDAVAGRVRLVGRGGYWLTGGLRYAEPLLAGDHRVLWHPGAGGSIGWADLDTGVGAVICHNRLFDWEQRPRVGHPYEAIVDLVDSWGGRPRS